jgi:hypothetical protein
MQDRDSTSKAFYLGFEVKDFHTKKLLSRYLGTSKGFGSGKVNGGGIAAEGIASMCTALGAWYHGG